VRPGRVEDERLVELGVRDRPPLRREPARRRERVQIESGDGRLDRRAREIPVDQTPVLIITCLTKV
jgi:hypothetical protein